METEKLSRDEIYSLVASQISNLIEKAELQTREKGQVIFYADHKPLGFYFVENGRIAMEFPNNKKEKRILIPKKHCIIGLDFMLADVPYPFTARAESPVKTWFVSRNQAMSIYQGSRN